MSAIRTVSRGTGLAIAAEAATFLVASLIHFGIGFDSAAGPELLIAAILGWTGAGILRGELRYRGLPLAATAFATVGTILGLVIIATGKQDAPDLAYHSAILVALIATLGALLRPVSRVPLQAVREGDGVRVDQRGADL